MFLHPHRRTPCPVGKYKKNMNIATKRGLCVGHSYHHTAAASARTRKELTEPADQPKLINEGVQDREKGVTASIQCKWRRFESKIREY